MNFWENLCIIKISVPCADYEIDNYLHTFSFKEGWKSEATEDVILDRKYGIGGEGDWSYRGFLFLPFFCVFLKGVRRRRRRPWQK